MSITIRNATAEDLDRVMAVEESWPEVARAPREKFVSRMEKFPAGFFLAEQDGKACGTITSCPFQYDPENLHRLRSWNEVTNNGYLHDIEAIENYNSLYIVSGVVDENVRGGDVIERLALAEVDLARRLGLDYVVAGAVLPGYVRYCEKHGPIAAPEYAMVQHGTRLVDPLLEKYRRIGFTVPGVDHVIAEYFPDARSMNYAAIVVRAL